MDPSSHHDGTRHPSRRRFIQLAGGAAGLAAATACKAAPYSLPYAGLPAPSPSASDSFDPWLEILGDAFRHNVGEAARLAGGRPILAVVKNNGYGLGDQTVAPLMEGYDAVGGIACVRVAEAIAMREARVTKPILVMAETSEDEIVELVSHGATPTVWGDDAAPKLDAASRRLRRPIPVQLFIDTGMNREGMPYTRARPWMEGLITRESTDVVGTYTMFSHDLDFDRDQMARFREILDWADERGLPLGTLHASPTVELFHYPEAHLDMVRPGNALFGNYPSGEGVRDMADLQTVFRLCCRVARVERLEPGESAGFYRTFEPEHTTHVALLPIGRTDGYPSGAQGTCEVLIGGRLYPVVGGVNSAHAIVDVGPDPSVQVGDVVTLIGPDDPAIYPHEVAERTGGRFLALIQSMNARLPRIVV